jgi:hypothetical protein
MRPGTALGANGGRRSTLGVDIGDTFLTQKQRESGGTTVNPQPLSRPESGS